MVTLKVEYSRKYKNDHMKYYGEKKCSCIFHKVSKVVDNFSENYHNFGSRYMYTGDDYIEIRLEDKHLYPINDLIERLKSIEEIGNIHIV